MTNIEKKRKIREINHRMIKRMRKEGRSLYEISLHVNLTCERVRQIERDILGLKARGHKMVKRISRKCANPKCAKVMTIKVGDERKHCCRACFVAMIPHKTPEQIRIEHNDRIKRYYHAKLKFDPVFKKKTKIRNKLAADKIKKSKWKNQK